MTASEWQRANRDRYNAYQREYARRRRGSPRKRGRKPESDDPKAVKRREYMRLWRAKHRAEYNEYHRTYGKE